MCKYKSTVRFMQVSKIGPYHCTHLEGESCKSSAVNVKNEYLMTFSCLGKKVEVLIPMGNRKYIAM